ncbi:MAG TPA: IclR family transcriptional regulator [Mycobacteriales bacterium]|nr:IclR family transcriptional regulator [Mycobacteriales bacterium]
MAQGTVQSVDRALRLMWQVRDHPGITLSALSSAGDLLPSTALRLMATLEHHRLVERDRDTKGYRLGAGARSLVGGPSFADRLEPAVEALAATVGEQVSLAVLDGRSVHHILTVDGASRAGQEIILRTTQGRRDLNLNAIALGKVLLAFAPDDVAEALIGGLSFERTADRTIDSAAELRRHLATVRRKGHAFSMDENTNSVAGVAAPIRRDEVVVAAIAVHGPRSRLSPSRLRTIVPDLLAAAESCTRTLT